MQQTWEFFLAVSVGSFALAMVAVTMIATVTANQRRRLKLQQEQLIAVQASEAKYRDLFDNSLVGMVRVSLHDGAILDTNQAFLRMIGVPVRADLRALFQHFPTEAYASLRETILKTGVVEEFQFSLQKEDGSTVWLLFSGRKSSEGNYVEGVLQDVTERVLAQEAMINAKKLEAIGILAGGMAHDLKNIFKPMQMMIDSIKSKGLEPSQLGRVELLEEGVGLGLNLVAKVLDFAKGGSSVKSELSVNVLLKRLKSFLNEIRSEQLRIVVSENERIDSIYADESQAYQVLYNLCLNAKDAMPNGGELHIAAENCEMRKGAIPADLSLTPGPFVRIRVRDTGAGIPPKFINSIWEPFFSTKGSRGTGLGLATALNIVRSHGGTITVESVQGKGSCFAVYFPSMTGQAATKFSAADVRIPAIGV